MAIKPMSECFDCREHQALAVQKHKQVVTGAACCCRYVCDERWYNLTRSIRLRGLGFAGQESLRQPTWCTLPPDKFHALSARASQQQRPENILLIYKTAPKPRPARPVPGPVSSNITHAGLPVAALAMPQSLQVLAAPQAGQ